MKPTFSLRPATDDDQELCYKIHCSAMRDVVDRVFGWDEEDQRARFARGWSAPELQVIMVDGNAAGMLSVADRPNDIYLWDIELDPAFQGRGIGSAVIQGLQSSSAERGMPLLLEVFAVNDRAKALYARLGFREVGRHGPKIHMRWDSGAEPE